MIFLLFSSYFNRIYPDRLPEMACDMDKSYPGVHLRREAVNSLKLFPTRHGYFRFK